MGETSFAEKYSSILQKGEFPANPAISDVQFDVSRSAFLAGMTVDLLAEVRKKRDSSKDLEDLVARAARAITKGASKVTERYLQVQYISDEMYTEATTPVQEVAPLAQIAGNIATLYEQFSDLQPILRSLATPGDKKSQARHAQIHVDGFLAQFKVVEKDEEASDQAVKEFFEHTVESTREGYVERRKHVVEELDSFVAYTNRLMNPASDDEYQRLFAEWAPGEHYVRLSELLKDPKSMPAAELQAFEARLKGARAQIVPSLPLIREQTLVEAQARAVAARENTEHLLVYNESGISEHDAEPVETATAVQAIRRNLSSKEIFELLGEKPDDRAKALDQPLNDLREQLEFFRKGKNSLIYLAHVATGQIDPFGVKGDFHQVAVEYGNVFGQHSWKSKAKSVGAYKLAEHLRVATLERLDAQLTLARKSTDTILKTFLDTGVFNDELWDTTQAWSDVADMILKGSKNDKSQGMLYKAVSYSAAYKNLVAMLKEPITISRAIREFRDLGRANFDEVDDSKVFKSYSKQLTEIERHIAALPPVLRQSTMIEQLSRQIYDSLARQLAQRGEKIVSQRRRDVRFLHDVTLEKHALRLEKIVLEAQAAGATQIAEKLQSQYEGYKAEAELRKTPFMRQWRKLQAKFRGDVPELLYEPDTSVLMQAPDALAFFGPENGVVLDAAVWRELEHLKDGRDEEAAKRAHRAIAGVLATLGIERDPREMTLHQEYLGKGLSIFLDTPVDAGPIYWYNRHARLERLATRSGLIGALARTWNSIVETLEEKVPADRRILQDARLVSQAAKKPLGKAPQVITVTKDFGMPLNSIDTPVPTQNYRRGSIFLRPEQMYPGYRYISLPDSLWRDIIAAPTLTEEHRSFILEAASAQSRILPNPEGDIFERDDVARFYPNEFVFARNPNDPLQTVILRYTNGILQPLQYVPELGQKFPLVYFDQHPEQPTLVKFHPRGARQAAAADLTLDKNILVALLAGGNGSGKTLISAAGGAYMVRSNHYPYEKIDLTVPKVVDKRRGEGFVPGDLQKKQLDRAQGFLDNLSLVHGLTYDPERSLSDTVSESASRGVPLRLNSLESIRGQSIVNTLRIGDEFQNATYEDAEVWSARLSEGSKNIVTGDPWQYDGDARNFRFNNALLHLRVHFLGYQWYGHMTLRNVERGVVAEAVHNIRQRRGL